MFNTPPVSRMTTVRLRPFEALLSVSGGWALVSALAVAGLLIALGVTEPVLFWSLVGGTSVLVFAWSVYRVALEIDDDELRVFNVRKTYRIPWESVQLIDSVGLWLSPSALLVGNTAIRVTTREGD